MIRPFSLNELIPLLTARLIGEDLSFSAVSIDSRHVNKGELFIAIKGDRFDGHDYVMSAVDQGASAVMVEYEIKELTVPQLIVSNCREALGKLGAFNRSLFPNLIIGVTGSSGKTTVKEFMAAIFRQNGEVLATEGNLNNELGVPLTLLKITEAHKFAVLEMGASAIGEIAYSVALVKPNIVVITNASDAHIGKFGGVENIVEAKGEILEGLSSDGVAILNLDDPVFDVWKTRAGAHKVLSFSKENDQADCYGKSFDRNRNGCLSFTLHTPEGEEAVELNVLGQHNITNACAAAAAAYAGGLALADIVKGLNTLVSVKGRTRSFLGLGGARVIDDSYNASPASAKAAIDLLGEFRTRRVLVLGDMAELGEWAQSIHEEIGRYATNKIDTIYGVGPLTQYTINAFGGIGRHFDNKEELAKALSVENDVNITILIKGSRSMAMETLVSELCGSEEGKH